MKRDVIKALLLIGTIIVLSSAINLYYLSPVYSYMITSSKSNIFDMGLNHCLTEKSLNESFDISGCLSDIRELDESMTVVPNDFFEYMFYTSPEGKVGLVTNAPDKIIQFLSPLILGIVLVVASLLGLKIKD